jgi:dTDP-4-dehydrorhamnose 3,5-epimerase
MNADDRGVLAEVYRAEWSPESAAVQWNFIRTEAGVMRGVRVHVAHDDYVVVLHGRLCVGMRDVRRGSPTDDLSAVVELGDEELTLLSIPAGVAHGLYSVEPSLFLIGVSSYHDPDDQKGCHWADPDLGIPWPFSSARVSERDAVAGSVAEMLARVPPWSQRRSGSPAIFRSDATA